MNVETITLGAVNTNCHIVCSRGEAIVIDPACDGEAIYEKTDALGVCVKYILLTHGHFDHIGGVDALARLTGARIYVHALDVELLCDGNKNASIPFGIGGVVCREQPVAFDDGDTFTVGDVTLTAHHTPGHTRGSSCFLADGAAFTGDTVFTDGGYGRTDLYGGDRHAIYDSLRSILPELKGRTVYPGHGINKDF